MAEVPASGMLGQRLLQEIKDLKDKPYDGIELHANEADLSKACLILTPEGKPALHLTILRLGRFPLQAPKITIQSEVSHPNVFDSYICASILNTEDGYTPAYTLKGICIQMLSFFSSDSIEQEYGGTIDLKHFEGRRRNGYRETVGKDDYQCKDCGYSTARAIEECEQRNKMAATSQPRAPADGDEDTAMIDMEEDQKLVTINLPPEILLMITEFLETEEILLAAHVIDGFSSLIGGHNIIRTRELECFVLKQGFTALELGIGVKANSRPRSIESEFDIVSREAYEKHGIRKAVQGLDFSLWLPLPIAPKHWDRVRKYLDNSLSGIARQVGIQGPLDTVIYTFMNDIVVRLSQDAENAEKQISHPSPQFASDGGSALKSTLTHASEKAVESYYHLFHVLLCMAAERPQMVADANLILNDFVKGKRDKQRVPNLGHLLISILISDEEVSTTELNRAIISEAITRNVVWMLSNSNPELSFLETSDISPYRLHETFKAGKTSYRILMFFNLMRQVVREARTKTEIKQKEEEDEDGKKHKVWAIIDGKRFPVMEEVTYKMNVGQMRDDLFARHGAPPVGAAARIANEIRKIQKIDSFPDFVVNMGLKRPTASWFSDHLRCTVRDSHARGYSVELLRQEEALYLRLGRDYDVERPFGMRAEQPPISRNGRFDFFPKRGGAGGGAGGGRGGGGGGPRGGGNWRGGRGGGRGRY